MNKNIIKDPQWLAHRYDSKFDQFHFIKASREDCQNAVFLTDDYLKNAQSPIPVNRQDMASIQHSGKTHFIFHSAYCCSTLLTKAFDMPGYAFGLKEPVILNDIVGWRAREKPALKLFNDVLNDALKALSRPFTRGEVTLIKPSNLVNVIAPEILNLLPNAKAIFLHAPLEDYLASIARKGLWGRLWVRELMVKQMRDGFINLGLQTEDYLKLTDMQSAAVGWLAQHQAFANLCRLLGDNRIFRLNSSHFMQSNISTINKAAEHFEIYISEQTIHDICNSSLFKTHSKTNTVFDASSRKSDKMAGSKIYADELEKVVIWAHAVADNAGIKLEF